MISRFFLIEGDCDTMVRNMKESYGINIICDSPYSCVVSALTAAEAKIRASCPDDLSSQGKIDFGVLFGNLKMQKNGQLQMCINPSTAPIKLEIGSGMGMSSFLIIISSYHITQTYYVWKCR
jgi:hypothetical protein